MEEPQITEAWYPVSDYHMGPGAVLPDGRPNRREDFKGDDTYDRMLDVIEKSHGDDVSIGLIWDGDMVDFHALTYRGKYGMVPTVEAALEKLEQCIKGHRRAWKATRDFLKRPRRRLVIIFGNHDLEFVWPEVQARIREYLEVPEGDERLVFAHEWRIGDVVIQHGAEYDILNANPPPDKLFITDKVGGKGAVATAAVIVMLTYGSLISVARRTDYTPKSVTLALVCGVAAMMVFGWLFRKLYFWKWGSEKKFLNVQYGSILNAWLGQRLKGVAEVGEWIGRMHDHGPIWLLSFARDWRFALFAFPLLIAHMVYHRFFIDLLDVRRKATLRMTLKLIASTGQEDQPETLMRKVLEERKDVRVVFYGHTHKEGVETIRRSDGSTAVVYNLGTGGERVRVAKPEITCRTRHKGAEAFLRRIGYHWRHRTKAAIGLTVLHVATGAAAGYAALRVDWLPLWISWFALALSAFSLFMRQSYALYRGESYTLFTPGRILLRSDETTQASLLRFSSLDDKLEDYL
jgi:hypothetical protein